MSDRGKKTSKSKSKSASTSQAKPDTAPCEPSSSTGATPTGGIYSRIIIQPAPNKYRFRYEAECLARSAGTLPGETTTKIKDLNFKSYPTIEIGDHNGALVQVSCVTKDKPYRAHPHKLVSRNFCDRGVCKMVVEPGKHVVQFNFGIQSEKIKESKASLELRETMKVDPFKQGFAHKEDISSIDLKALRLCFQVYLKRGIKYHPLATPLVSNVIFDSKTINDFWIYELSRCSGSVKGGNRVMLTCNKVSKKGLSVTFFSDKEGDEKWSCDASIKTLHKQVTIIFYTPPYKDLDTPHDVSVFVQLRNESECSNALPFEYIAQRNYIPTYDEYYLEGKKRKRLSHCSSTHRLNSDLCEEPSSSCSVQSPHSPSVGQASSQDFVITIPQSNLRTKATSSAARPTEESQLINLDEDLFWPGQTQSTLSEQDAFTSPSYGPPSQGVSQAEPPYQLPGQSGSQQTPLTQYYEQSHQHFSQESLYGQIQEGRPISQTSQLAPYCPSLQDLFSNTSASQETPKYHLQPRVTYESYPNQQIGELFPQYVSQQQTQPNLQPSSFLYLDSQQPQMTSNCYQGNVENNPQASGLLQSPGGPSQVLSNVQQFGEGNQQNVTSQIAPGHLQTRDVTLGVVQPQATYIQPSFDYSSPMAYNFDDLEEVMNQVPCNIIDEIMSQVKSASVPVQKDGDVTTLTRKLEALRTNSDPSSDDQEEEADDDKS